MIGKSKYLQTLDRLSEIRKQIEKSLKLVQEYESLISEYELAYPEYEKINPDEIPRYVSMGLTENRTGSELRLCGNVYYRDAGHWDVGFYKKDGKFYSRQLYGDMDWLDDVELVPISEDVWRKANEGYINDDTKAYYEEDSEEEDFYPQQEDEYPF